MARMVDCSKKNPSFMKLLINDFTKKLLIPPKFVRLHRETLPKKCTLKPTGTQSSWPVRTKLIDNHLYFTKGWKAFAQQYSLQYGNMLIFRYDQDSEFYVDMFDNSCCSRELVTTNTAPMLPTEALVPSSEFPAFTKIMKHAYVKSGGCLPVPQHFARKYFNNSTRDVKIEFSDKPGIVMVLRRQPSETSTFLGGWSDLARENSLKVDDVCVFKLIDREDCTLKLTIFRHTSGAGDNQRHKQVEVITLDSSDSDSEVTPESKEPSPSEKALEEAKKFISNSRYPSLLTVMRRSYIEHGLLHVPRTFVKEMSKKSASGSKVKLQYSENELTARMNRAHRGCCMIQAGWRTIIKKESIRINDVCVLELINKEDNVIKISVFRCNS